MSAEIIMFVPRPNPNREKEKERERQEHRQPTSAEYVAPEKDPA